MELRNYEFREPGQLLRDVTVEHPLTAGDVLLVLVHRPSAEQRVVAVSRLEPERWRHLDQHERSELLAREVEAMPIPEWHPGPREHAIMTIVARNGWCLIGANEGEWLNAWWFSHYLADVSTGDLILITEHGWTDFMTDLGGVEPRLPRAA